MTDGTFISTRERIDYAKRAIHSDYQAHLDALDMRYILHDLDHSGKKFATRFAVNVSDFLSLNYSRLRDVFPGLHMDESDIASALYEMVTEDYAEES